MRMALTLKQKMFIDEYLVDLNATQAAIRAGYSPKTAKDIASQNLAKLNIRIEIDKRMAERSKRVGMNADRVLQELGKLAFVKIEDVIDFETGRIKPTATSDDLAAIQSIKIKPGEYGTEREIKFYDKKATLELLGKHLGLWTDKQEIEHTGSVQFVDDIE
jgi:hypothetical protein|nr:MAG TPA: Terminase small subunit [Caudoviricetes sp.]